MYVLFFILCIYQQINVKKNFKTINRFWIFENVIFFITYNGLQGILIIFEVPKICFHQS